MWIRHVKFEIIIDIIIQKNIINLCRITTTTTKNVDYTCIIKMPPKNKSGRTTVYTNFKCTIRKYAQNYDITLNDLIVCKDWRAKYIFLGMVSVRIFVQRSKYRTMSCRKPFVDDVFAGRILPMKCFLSCTVLVRVV